MTDDGSKPLVGFVRFGPVSGAHGTRDPDLRPSGQAGKSREPAGPDLRPSGRAGKPALHGLGAGRFVSLSVG